MLVVSESLDLNFFILLKITIMEVYSFYRLDLTKIKRFLFAIAYLVVLKPKEL